ncbi:hypothetical protein LXA43DRAFT_1103981 [Ganoderma leucocontextum]|nr:hypothetical protein LXA43DRAFT_1103981 [Ganoderma leucocontextum]
MPDAPFEQGRPLQAGYNYEWTFVSSPTPTLYLRRKPEHQRKQRSGSNIRPHAILPYAIPPARKTGGRIVPSRASPHVAGPATSVIGEGPSGTPWPGGVTSQPLNSIVGPGLGGSENVPGVQPSPLDSPQTVQPSLLTAALHSPRASQHQRTEAEQPSSIDEDEESLFGDTWSPPSDCRPPPSDLQRTSGDVESPHRDVHRSVSTPPPQQPSDARATQTLQMATGLGDLPEFQLADIHPTIDASLFSFDPELFPDLFSPSFLATPHDYLNPIPTSNTLLTPDLQSFLDSWPVPDPHPQPEAHRSADPSYVPPERTSFMQAPLYPAMMSLPSMDAGSMHFAVGFGAQSADYNVQDITDWPLEQ